MKKCFIVLVLCTSFTVMSSAQSPLVKGTPVSGQTSSVIYDDGVHIGIGTTTPAAALHVLNTQSGPYTAGTSLQLDRSIAHFSGGPVPTFTTVTDLIVSGAGLTGLGVITPAAHLDITDQNSDGQPLLQVTASGASTPSMYVDYEGTVSLGDVSYGTGFPLEVHGIAGVWGDMGVWGNGMMTGQLILGGDGDKTGQLDIRAQSLTGASYVSQISLVDPNLKAFRVNLNGAPPAETFTLYGDGRTIIGNGSNLGSLHLYSSAIAAYGYANLTEVSNSNTKALAVSNSGDKFVVYGDGHTVIGTPSSTPSIYSSSNTGGYSLYVQGGVLAERYKCALSSTSDWSDYVFDKNYKLTPLSDVEAYIKTNKHLPGVPSAEDVHCEGIDMAQMDATLLKKIEELTLYTLELKKEIDLLKSQK